MHSCGPVCHARQESRAEYPTLWAMSTFVIVHGAWGGAWSWNKFVVPLLREAGQTVYAVTLTGLGERSHLASPDVSLDTHIQDVINVLFYEDLTDVILV